MNKYTNTLHKKKLPPSILKELTEFTNWHLNLKSHLDKLNLKGEAELSHLKEILPTHRQYYFDKVERLGNLCKDFNLVQKKALFEEIALSGLHDMLKDCHYFYRSIFKPRGYAGDAEMMALIYRNEFEGADLFSKLIHKIGNECAACIAIRNRKKLLYNAFQSLDTGSKVLSLAAGPAEEIHEYMNEKNDLDFLALDHDVETLKAASKKNQHLNYGIINAFHLIKGSRKYLVPKKSKINKCHPKTDTKGINKLLLPFKYSIKELKANTYDLVYSAGLFDYIKTFESPNKGTIALTKILFDSLKPGGRLLIGNVSPQMPIGVIWAMECLCDWYLIYRTKAEVLNFASSIPENEIESIEVIAEETVINWFLDIQKR